MRKIEIIFIIIFFCNCTVSHQSIDPSGLEYTYNYDASLPFLFIPLNDSREGDFMQRKYKRKLNRKQIQVVPLKVINQTDSVFVFSKNTVDVLVDFELVEIMDKQLFLKKIKQKAGSSIPCFVIGSWFLSGYFLSSYQSTLDKKYILTDKNILIPYLLGAVNIGLTYRANKKLSSNLEDIYLDNKEIAPGDTICGIFAIKNESEINKVLIRTKDEK